jgi:hypothetical protein
MFVDAHMHADTRSYEDFGKMRVAGIDTVITCAHDFLRMSSSHVYFDHFDRLLNREVNRAGDNGIELYVALGIHPEGIPSDYTQVIKKLPEYLDRERVVAVGEIGLEQATEVEVTVFREQLEIALDMNLPVVIHTPRIDKKKITGIIVEILDKLKFPPEKVLVDHSDRDNLSVLEDRDFFVGLSIQPPSKLTSIEAAEIIREGKNNFVVNSDCSSKASDIYAVPKCFADMERMGVEEKKRWNAVSINARKLFNLP